uniref:Variant surface glycoprotein n=1 Tax=Trypanosoma brucei TaxID=5691 RepID=A0A1V0FZ53_9TRYP|nr:variant surface glycoprotein [Trypanosoma brucei]
MIGSFRQATAIAAAAALVFSAGVTAVGDGIKEAGWKPLCGLTVTLEKAADLALGQIQQVTTCAEQYTLASLKLQILAQMETNDTKQLGYSALAAAAAAKADMARQTLATLQSEDIPGLFYAGDLRGNIGGVLNLLMAGDKGTTTNFCLANSGGTGKADNLDSVTCANKFHSVKGKTTKLGNEITPTGFKNVATDNAISNGGATDGKCVLTTAPSDGTSTFFKNQADTTIMSGTVKLKAHDTTGEWIINAGHPIAEAGQASGSNLLAKTYNALQGIERRDISGCTADSIESAVEGAATAAEYVAALTEMLKKPPYNLQTPKLEVTANQLKADISGPANTGMKQLLTEIKQKQAKGVETTGATTSNLEALNSLADLLKVLSYYTNERSRQVTNLQKEVADAQAKSTPPSAKATETDETCKAKGLGADCKDGCKVEGTGEKAKCVVDDSKFTTQTNTTPTGEGATAKEEGKKCSEKTKQEECKDGCKWEGKECKDSSILVNKH